VHNEQDSTLAFILSNMTMDASLPRPLGVFQAVTVPSYEQQMTDLVQREQEKKGSDLHKLLRGNDSWVI